VALAADYDPEFDKFVISGNRLYVLKEARMAPKTAASNGQVVVMSPSTSSTRAPDDQGPHPYAVVCYELEGV